METTGLQPRHGRSLSRSAVRVHSASQRRFSNLRYGSVAAFAVGASQFLAGLKEV
jgi:hypothetical protein